MEDYNEYLSEDFVEESLEADEMSVAEAGFIHGWREAEIFIEEGNGARRPAGNTMVYQELRGT